MNVPPEVIDALRLWVRKAEHDLEAANRIIAIEDGCPFDTVCFHCQQVAEKYLKCFLTYLGVQAPRTHDLKILSTLIPGDQLMVDAAIAAELNQYAVNVRYVDDWREPQAEDARRALEQALDLRDRIRCLLPDAALV